MSLDETDIGLRELAGMLGLQARHVQELADRGLIVRTSYGKYRLGESVRLYTKHLREIASGRGGEENVLDLTKERARLAKQQADGQEIKNAALRREFVSAAEVEAAWSTDYRNFRSKMISVPSRVRQRLGHLTAHDVQTIDTEIRLALTEAAHVDDTNGGPSPGSEEPDTAPENDAFDVDREQYHASG